MKLLWIPHTSWHLPQRARDFCFELSLRHEVHVTNWVTDFHRATDYFSLKYLKNFRYACYRDANVLVHDIPRFSPAFYSKSLQRLNEKIYHYYLERIVARYQIEVVIGTYVAPPLNKVKLVFDLYDDNPGYWRYYHPDKRGAEMASRIEAQEQAYFQLATSVVGVSSALLDVAKNSGTHAKLFYIPNGVNLRSYHQLDEAKIESLRLRLGLKGRYVVGLIGNHDKSYELEKVLAAAELLKTNSMVFLIVGRGAALPWLQTEVLRRGLTNFIFTGFISPLEVPLYFKVIDVGLCPYKDSPPANVSSPLRLLHYTAAGKAVVSTRLKVLEQLNFSNVILVEDSVEGLVNGIKNSQDCRYHQYEKRIEEFDLPTLARKYEQVLEY